MVLTARRFSPLRYAWIAVGAAAVAVVAYMAVLLFAPPPDDLDVALSKSTQDGRYLAAIESEADPVPEGEMHSWILVLAAPDGTPVSDADVVVDGGMPDHGHGLPTEPGVSALGDGRYRVEGVRFNMAGHWVLRFAISAEPGEDEVAFNVVL